MNYFIFLFLANKTKQICCPSKLEVPPFLRDAQMENKLAPVLSFFLPYFTWQKILARRLTFINPSLKTKWTFQSWLNRSVGYAEGNKKRGWPKWPLTMHCIHFARLVTYISSFKLLGNMHYSMSTIIKG